MRGARKGARSFSYTRSVNPAVRLNRSQRTVQDTILGKLSVVMRVFRVVLLVIFWEWTMVLLQEGEFDRIVSLRSSIKGVAPCGVEEISLSLL